MKDEQKRFGKGFAVALAVHLVLAAGLGIFGYRFVHTPPEILEVSLEGGGGGAEAQEEEIEQEEQQEEPIIQSLEDIIDQKLKPKPQKKIVKKKATAAPGPKAPAVPCPPTIGIDPVHNPTNGLMFNNFESPTARKFWDIIKVITNPRNTIIAFPPLFKTLRFA